MLSYYNNPDDIAFNINGKRSYVKTVFLIVVELQ